MLLLILILLIDVTFSTPTGVYAQNQLVIKEMRIFYDNLGCRSGPFSGSVREGQDRSGRDGFAHVRRRAKSREDE